MPRLLLLIVAVVVVPVAVAFVRVWQPVARGVTAADASSTPVVGEHLVGERRAARAPKRTVLVGAGDIASCQSRHDEGTAAVLDGVDGLVFTLGDNVYGEGDGRQLFQDCYGPSWGRHLARTRPAVGNHEYESPAAAAHFDYFGSSAGAVGQGWYAYDAGSWRVYVINSNCNVVVGGCAAGSPQQAWLAADLAATPRECVLAYWHHPMFSSGVSGSPFMRPVFETLYDAGAEMVISGHDHDYERFRPLDPSGAVDLERGIRTFVVGTGGAGLRRFDRPALATTVVRDDRTYGVLKLELAAGTYRWEFLSAAGRPLIDSGTGQCH